MSDSLEDNSIDDATDNDRIDASLENNHERPPSANIEEKMKKARKILRKAGLGTMVASGIAIVEYFAGKHPHNLHHKFPSFIYPMAIFVTFLFGLWLFLFSFVLPKHPKSVCRAKMLRWIAVVLVIIASCLKILVHVMS